jgi:hypothetical protein
MNKGINKERQKEADIRAETVGKQERNCFSSLFYK